MTALTVVAATHNRQNSLQVSAQEKK